MHILIFISSRHVRSNKDSLVLCTGSSKTNSIKSSTFCLMVDAHLSMTWPTAAEVNSAQIRRQTVIDCYMVMQKVAPTMCFLSGATRLAWCGVTLNTGFHQWQLCVQCRWSTPLLWLPFILNHCQTTRICKIHKNNKMAHFYCFFVCSTWVLFDKYNAVQDDLLRALEA